MPRTMRVEYPGAIYHVMDRGDRQEDVFVNDVDRQDLLKTLAEACQKTGWQVHAYGLMRNHFHRVLATPQANLVEGMRWFLSACTIRLNHRQKLQQIIELMDGQLGEHHSGQLHRQTAEQKANRLISQELSRLGWTESDLASRLKNDPGKLAMAARVRKETTLPVKWIAARLQMGTAKSLKPMLQHWIHTREEPANHTTPRTTTCQ